MKETYEIIRQGSDRVCGLGLRLLKRESYTHIDVYNQIVSRIIQSGRASRESRKFDIALYPTLRSKSYLSFSWDTRKRARPAKMKTPPEGGRNILVT